jgi:hypothetical protein
MMIDKRAVNNNYNSNTVVKQDFAVVKQVDGRAAHMTETFTSKFSARRQPWPPWLAPSGNFFEN